MHDNLLLMFGDESVNSARCQHIDSEVGAVSSATESVRLKASATGVYDFKRLFVA